MRNLKRSIVSMLLVILIFLSSIVPVSAASDGQPSKYSKDSNSGTRDVVCTTLDGTSASTYYTGSYQYDLLDDLSGSTLQTTLRSLMTSTHKKKTTYNNCRDMVFEVDCENNNTSRATTLYTSYSMSSSDWTPAWNCDREHVWPKSLGGDSTTGGGADLHHIRPAEKKVNGTRSNKKYGEGSNSSVIGNLSGDIGGTYGTYFEPLDNVKGDVARICLYVLVRWDSDWGATSITKVFQSVDVLLEWCEMDPVDTWEMGRNEVVQNIQGNRNVFIDYPELAWLLFDREIPENMTTPSGNAGGSTTPSCSHSNTELRNAKPANCGYTGYTGDVYCKDCGEMTEAGSTILATGNHSWSDRVVVTEPTETAPGKAEQTCSVCSLKQTFSIPYNCKHTSTEVRDAKDPTCVAEGYTGNTYCKSCGIKTATGSAIAPTGEHSWSEVKVTVKPTLTTDGTGVQSCVNCTETKTVSIPYDDSYCVHTNTEVRNDKAATCTKEGYTGDTYCKDCGVKTATGSAIAPTGEHSWSEKQITVEPTPDKHGEATQTCVNCSTKRTVIVHYEATGTENLTFEEKVVAIITKELFESLFADYLTKA